MVKKIKIWGAFCLGILFSLSVTSLDAFEFRGFGDVTYTQGANTPVDSEFRKGSFGLGQLDFYVAENISRRLNVLGEVVVETPGEETIVDLERLEIGYSFRDELNLRLGRFHNLLGYWNLNFHHGAHLQTSIGRPEFLNFEDDGGILPVHVTGIWLRGRYKTQPLILEYGIMTGNGNSLKDRKIVLNVVRDNNYNKLFSFQLRLIPTIREELSLNIFGNFEDVEYDSEFRLENKPQGVIEQMILGFDFTYNTPRTEILVEYYNFNHQLGTKDYSSHAYYLQSGYKVTDPIHLYLRYENVRVEAKDPYFVILGIGNNERTVYGIRYDLSLMSAVKIEMRMIDLDGREKYEEYALQWSFAF